LEFTSELFGCSTKTDEISAAIHLNNFSWPTEAILETLLDSASVLMQSNYAVSILTFLYSKQQTKPVKTSKQLKLSPFFRIEEHLSAIEIFILKNIVTELRYDLSAYANKLV